MSIKISSGNSKLGRIPNVSLPPVASCAPGVPCAGKCYALKAFRQYPGTRAAWNHNLAAHNAGQVAFFNDILRQLQQKNPRFFRWHVAGDIQDLNYFRLMLVVCRATPETKHLCFTKRPDLVNPVLYQLGAQIPRNLRLVLSAWPGHIVDNPHGLPVAWLTTDPRRPREGFTCPGSCATCKHCWADPAGVTFNPH